MVVFIFAQGKDVSGGKVGGDIFGQFFLEDKLQNLDEMGQAREIVGVRWSSVIFIFHVVLVCWVAKCPCLN